MLYSNRELDRAFDFIAHTDFDMFCLQEVPEAFLKRLQTLSYFISSRIDVEEICEEGDEILFAVILSKHPIVMQGEIIFPDYMPLLSLRTRVFVRLMRSFGFFKIRNRGAVFADIRVPDIPSAIRVFSLHLILAQPAWRLQEFEIAMVKRNQTQSTIVCGDFNIIESPFMAPLNWILGGSLADAFFYHRERTRIEKSFAAHELANPLHGKNTHSFALSQLDHILVSHSFSIKKTEVVLDRYGSDHHPIFLEVA